MSLISDALANSRLGQYQLQAAIAAVHAEAPSTAATNWRQICALYALLERVTSNPMITLNRAVAVAMVGGPQDGWTYWPRCRTTAGSAPAIGSMRCGHLLEMRGDREGAVAAYARAARRTTSIPEQRYLEARAAAVSAPHCRGPISARQAASGLAE